jgi:hypothetical protein
MAKYQLDDMNNQITYLNKISYNKRNEIEYLQIGVQELEGMFAQMGIYPNAMLVSVIIIITTTSY